ESQSRPAVPPDKSRGRTFRRYRSTKLSAISFQLQRRGFKQDQVHIGEGAHPARMPCGEFGAAREPSPPEVDLRSPAVDQEAPRAGERALCQRGRLGLGGRGILEREQVDLTRNG